MADEKKKAVKLGGNNYYYVLVDGTDTVDSVAFGEGIETFGFRNLYSEKLKDNADPALTGRLVDPTHPYLPIWKAVRSGGAGTKPLKPKDPSKPIPGIAVITPGGFDSWGTDDSWPTGTAQTNLAKATTAIKEVILNPGVYMRSDSKMGLVAGTTKAPTTDKVRLVQLSSHGWLGGFMGGNKGSHWLVIGKVAKDGRGFKGPTWLVLAQCSTVCKATWPSWVKVFAKSSPIVRGVLAYEEVAPAASSAAGLALAFFDKMREKYPSGPNKGKPISFVDAWKYVNENAKPKRHWAAIVHADAVNDSVSLFDEMEKTPVALEPDPLKPRDWTGKTPTKVYLGWSHTADEKIDGKPISEEPAPFLVKLERASDTPGGWREEYDEANLDQASLYNKGASFETGHYEVTLGAPKPIAEATIEWVHIRLSKAKFKTSRIFEKVEPPTNVTVKYDFHGNQRDKDPKDKSLYTFTVPSGTTLTSLVAKFTTVKTFKDVGTHDDHYKYDDLLVEHHSYLWIRAGLTLVDGTKIGPHDFPTRGLLYYGDYS